MANSEDVLDDIDVIALQNGVGPLERELIYRLAAVVRELRRDRARLDWLETCQSITTGRENRYEVIGTTRTQIDKAMAGGEGEA